MRRITLLIAALVCSTELFAQFSGRVTSTHGTVVEKVTVVTIEPEVAEDEKEEREVKYPQYDANIGYQQEISAGWWWATHCDKASAFRLSYTAGKRFNNYLFAGLGAGLDIATRNTYQARVIAHQGDLKEFGRDICCFDLPIQKIAIPIFANFKVYMAKTKFAPYLSFSFGGRFSSPKTLTFKSTSLLKYGSVRPFFDFALGANIRNSEKLSYTFQIGYYTQNADYFQGCEYFGGGGLLYRKYWYHGLKLSIGMTF